MKPPLICYYDVSCYSVIDFDIPQQVKTINMNGGECIFYKKYIFLFLIKQNDPVYCRNSAWINMNDAYTILLFCCLMNLNLNISAIDFVMCPDFSVKKVYNMDTCQTNSKTAACYLEAAHSQGQQKNCNFHTHPLAAKCVINVKFECSCCPASVILEAETAEETSSCNRNGQEGDLELRVLQTYPCTAEVHKLPVTVNCCMVLQNGAMLFTFNGPNRGMDGRPGYRNTAFGKWGTIFS